MSYTYEQYNEKLTYLVNYALADWVPFIPVEGAARELLGEYSNESEMTDLTLNIIGDMWESGVDAIQLLEGDDPPYMAWNLKKNETLRIIKERMFTLDPSDYEAYSGGCIKVESDDR